MAEGLRNKVGLGGWRATRRGGVEAEAHPIGAAAMVQGVGDGGLDERAFDVRRTGSRANGVSVRYNRAGPNLIF